MLRSSKSTKAGWQAAWQQRGIHFAKSHVGMALQVGWRGSLTRGWLVSVCCSVRLAWQPTACRSLLLGQSGTSGSRGRA